MATISFTKAVKYGAKGRIALIGPAGTGKSFTMLTAARALAGPEGKIAAIDTEQGSLAKYADQFDFDVAPLSEFTAENFLDALHAAEQGGYAVFCIDSLSHFWMGKGGALEFVDAASARSSSRDGMSGWKEFRPMEREMVDRMIASPCHIIATMRTKTAYEEQVNLKTGKKQRVKIGLAPVQRDGLEYEFDLVGSMDEDNTLIVDKTRFSGYAGMAMKKPAVKDFEPFVKWLDGPAAPTVEQPAEQKQVPAKTVASAASSKHPKPEELKQWAEAFAEADTLESFNKFIVPLMRERSREFIVATATEAKRRGWVADRSTGLYAERKTA